MDLHFWFIIQKRRKTHFRRTYYWSFEPDETYSDTVLLASF